MTAPFGITFGSAVDGLQILNEVAGGKYVVIPQAPHPSFSTYIVQVSKNHGIVWIKAITDPVLNDAFGHSLCSMVDRIHDQLSKKYGPGKKGGLLFAGSIWTEPQYWMQSLAANERQYCFLWDRKKVRDLPDDLQNIF